MQVTVGKVSFGTRKDGSINLKDNLHPKRVWGEEGDSKLRVSTAGRQDHSFSPPPTLSIRSRVPHVIKKVEEKDANCSHVYRSRQRIRVTEDRLKNIIDRHIRENGFESFESSRFVITDRK